MRKLWYRLRRRLCRDIVQDALTDALHPEFGWWWRDDEAGGKALAKEYKRGFVDGQEQGWEDCGGR